MLENVVGMAQVQSMFEVLKTVKLINVTICCISVPFTIFSVICELKLAL